MFELNEGSCYELAEEVALKPEGVKYSGQTLNGLPNGFGSLTWTGQTGQFTIEGQFAFIPEGETKGTWFVGGRFTFGSGYRVMRITPFNVESLEEVIELLEVEDRTGEPAVFRRLDSFIKSSDNYSDSEHFRRLWASFGCKDFGAF